LYGSESKLYSPIKVSVDECDFYRQDETDGLTYCIPSEILDDLTSHINEYGFTFDGCYCGTYVYQLNDNLFLTLTTSCHKSNNCPDGYAWVLDEPEFYAHVPDDSEDINGCGYANREYQLPVNLPQHQYEEIMNTARNKVTEQLGRGEKWTND
jgi:hypothetical protein